ncbi:MAG: hypothetical protein WBV74_05670 [Pseudonocardiaceae bacterium]
MVVRQLIPEGLAQVAPGPELAGLLAALELSQLSGYDCVEVLKARYQQFNHERARLMATMVEVGLCGIGPDDELPRTAVTDEFAADEIRAALMLTRRAAGPNRRLKSNPNHQQKLIPATTSPRSEANDYQTSVGVCMTAATSNSVAS